MPQDSLYHTSLKQNQARSKALSQHSDCYLVEHDSTFTGKPAARPVTGKIIISTKDILFNGRAAAPKDQYRRKRPKTAAVLKYKGASKNGGPLATEESEATNIHNSVDLKPGKMKRLLKNSGQSSTLSSTLQIQFKWKNGQKSGERKIHQSFESKKNENLLNYLNPI